MSILDSFKALLTDKGSRSEALKYLCRDDERNLSEESFCVWAKNKWENFEKTGPLEILPTKSFFSERGWHDERSNVYASYYDSEAFADIYEFGLYQAFISSLQQFICAGGEIDVEFFSPDKAKDGANLFVTSVHSKLKVLEGRSLKSHIQNWGLSDSIEWLSSLTPEYAFYKTSEDGTDYLIKEKNGYLSLFVIDDGLTREDFGLSNT